MPPAGGGPAVWKPIASSNGTTAGESRPAPAGSRATVPSSRASTPSTAGSRQRSLAASPSSVPWKAPAT